MSVAGYRAVWKPCPLFISSMEHHVQSCCVLFVQYIAVVSVYLWSFCCPIADTFFFPAICETS